jgi:hypothetical protein
VISAVYVLILTYRFVFVVGPFSLVREPISALLFDPSSLVRELNNVMHDISIASIQAVKERRRSIPLIFSLSGAVSRRRTWLVRPDDSDMVPD